MIKDFDHFTDAVFLMDADVSDMEVNKMGLISKKGEDWKNLRALILPAFSLKNMKIITPTVNE